MAYLVTATLAHTSGLPEDSVVMDWAVAGGNPADVPSHAAVLDAFAAFYSDAMPLALTSFGDYISSEISRVGSPHMLRLYDITNDLSGTPHGSPLAIQSFAIDAGAGGQNFPGEVALAITLEALGREDAAVEASSGTTRPKQRRTGRVYIGPLKVSAGVTTGTSRPSASIITHFLEAIDVLNADLIALSNGEALGVWSRSDATVRALEAVSIDNAWDTQRRRGVAATARTRNTLP
jgi:hypothetical protein